MRQKVSTLIGIAPVGVLTYPRPFRTDGDTIFSGAERSGVGKSSLTFDTEIAVPADVAITTPLVTVLTVTIVTGP